MSSLKFRQLLWTISIILFLGSAYGQGNENEIESQSVKRRVGRQYVTTEVNPYTVNPNLVNPQFFNPFVRNRNRLPPATQNLGNYAVKARVTNKSTLLISLLTYFIL
jgi:hypothetical protein